MKRAPSAGLALGWAEFRRGRTDTAAQRWLDFASQAPTDRRAADALLLAAELSAKAGDRPKAQARLSEVIAKFPNTEQAQVAALNRAILAIDSGQAANAVSELGNLVTRAPQSPQIGRMRLASGSIDFQYTKNARRHDVFLPPAGNSTREGAGDEQSSNRGSRPRRPRARRISPYRTRAAPLMPRPTSPSSPPHSTLKAVAPLEA